jgi:hypothetical protein
MMARGNESKPDGRSENRPTIHELFEDGREIDLALKRAIKEALLRHKKLGNSIVVWRDGEVVQIPPQEIPA